MAPQAPVSARHPFRRRAAALLLALAAAAATAPAAADKLPPGVAWRSAAADADIERAFAQARSERKPVLLYWGASWCPPCNRLKSTLFNRQDFIDRARDVVAVHVDGDGPGAQKLGARFKVSGYPTMVLMAADGAEITRLPGEVEPPRVIEVLQLGLAGGRPVQAVLADARAGKPLSGPEWRLLAWYGWDTDEDRLVAASERPTLLAELSRQSATAEPEASTRLLLKAIAESDDGKGIKADAALRERVTRLLADPKASRTHMDVLVYAADDLSRALAPEPGPERQALAAAFDSRLRRLQDDASLSYTDRLSALGARVELARLDQPRDTVHPKPDAGLKAVQGELKALAGRLDREVTNPYEHAVAVSSVGHLLTRADLWADSEALLKAGIARSHTPYYLMSQLGSNARKLKRPDEALRWYEQAFQRSEGPATRLQWGGSYLAVLLELAPQDAPRIERVATQLFREAGQDSGAFHERSERSLKRVGKRLEAWNQGGRHAAVLARLRAVLQPVCGKLDAADPQRAACEGVLKG